MRRILSLLVISLLLTRSGAAQRVEMLTSGTSTSLRGLSVVTDKLIWVSGSAGKVGKSLDGGDTWEWITIPNYERHDFRDIEAFDENTAVIMAISEPAVILRTTDGGKHWDKVYENTTKGMFLDAMDFTDNLHGMVIGDPIDGRIFLASTSDGGKHWQDLPKTARPVVDSGEACFASSGTNIKGSSKGYNFITGGIRSRAFIGANNHIPIDLPLIQGGNSTGANSIATNGQNIYVVGGDFSHDTSRDRNAAISHDGGHTWTQPAEPPHGYRSCVEYMNNHTLVACGTSGVDISFDGGDHWNQIATASFHACRIARYGQGKARTIYLSGSNGRIGRITF